MDGSGGSGGSGGGTGSGGSDGSGGGAGGITLTNTPLAGEPAAAEARDTGRVRRDGLPHGRPADGRADGVGTVAAGSPGSRDGAAEATGRSAAGASRCRRPLRDGACTGPVREGRCGTAVRSPYRGGVYRFLLTPRWWVINVFAVLAIPFCLFMGTWQLGRFETRVDSHREQQDQADEARTAAAAPLRDLLPVTTETSGRKARVTGRYDAGRQLLVPDREMDGRSGFYVLTPLRTDDGKALPVVRGWLPGDAGSKADTAAIPAPPAGRVTVAGALQSSESPMSKGVGASGGLPAGQLGVISAASLVNLVSVRGVRRVDHGDGRAPAADRGAARRPAQQRPGPQGVSRTSATPVSGSSSSASCSSCGSGSSAVRSRPSGTPSWASPPVLSGDGRPRCRSAKAISSRSCLIRSSTTREPWPAS
ncbi:hypothetical protein GCM10020221_14440 [Streptomyces thioluteus]|uniref:SURF1-like protein n=1 Tax=Streptomyces thioluteus TaxID=66431 RepID=A0ABN3WMP5_STRTU